MRITAPYFTKKPDPYYTADVKLTKETEPQSLGTQKTAVIEFNGNKLAEITVDERGHTRIKFHAALDYVSFAKHIKVTPVLDGDLSYLELDESLSPDVVED